MTLFSDANTKNTPEDLDGFKVYLKGATLETLNDLALYLDDLIANKTPDTVPSYVYEILRNNFLKRFSFEQVDSFKPWKMLTPAKKAQFQKAWIKAIQFFKKLDKRFVENSRLQDTIINMLGESPYFTDKLTFSDLLVSLIQIEVLFDLNFPNYRYTPNAIDLLVKAHNEQPA